MTHNNLFTWGIPLIPRFRILASLSSSRSHLIFLTFSLSFLSRCRLVFQPLFLSQKQPSFLRVLPSYAHWKLPSAIHRNVLLRYKFTAVQQWCREIKPSGRKGWGEVKRGGDEARSWEPYTRLLKWGMRVEEVRLPAERGRGGALQHGSIIYISKLFPRRATLCYNSVDIPKMHITHTRLSSHTDCSAHADQKLNLALWLCAVSCCSLRPVECFTVALGPNTHTHTRWSKVGRQKKISLSSVLPL